MLRAAIVIAFLATGLMSAQAEDPKTYPAETVASFPVPEARQAVAVDADAFYAITDRGIGRYDKKTGAKLATWTDAKDGPFIHLDSAVVIDGKLYAAHSNYPEWPMTSSIEIWDAATLQHIGTRSFGIDRGSLTWIDYRDGVWWGAFANYNRVFDRSPLAYGNKYNTQIVRFDADWRVAEAWVLPPQLIEKFQDMSNSGGSWGPDGRLWITGHDLPEFYAWELPKAGSVLRWVGTAPAHIAGQGIAWDRTQKDVIWGVIRDKVKGENRVTATRVQLP